MDISILRSLNYILIQSNPVGVASFSGYGTGFQDGEAYYVDVMESDPAYELIDWSEMPTGHINGSDVSLIANFELVNKEEELDAEKDSNSEKEHVVEPNKKAEVRYQVSAISQPEGVATFTGQYRFRSGDSYRVGVAGVEEGYRFVRWDTANYGVVDGEEVFVVAIFEAIDDEK